MRRSTKKSSTKPEVTVAMASHPPRREAMLRSIRTLLPYCTRLCLYLNNYSDDILDDLKRIPRSNKIVAVLAGADPATGDKRPLPDKKSHGKHHWLGYYDGYYLTCDDDCLYPADYVQEMVRAVQRYGDKAIIAVAGGCRRPCGRVEWVSTFNNINGSDTCINYYGSAASAMHPKAIGATRTLSEAVVEGSDNYIEDCFNDDTYVSVWANVNSIPIVMLSRPARWVLEDPAQFAEHAINKQKNYNSRLDAQIESQFKQYDKAVLWRLHDASHLIAKAGGKQVGAGRRTKTSRSSANHVTVAMASYPARRSGMLRVVEAMLPQCDKLYLYLNNYDDDVLDEIASIDGSDKVEAVLAGTCHKAGVKRELRDLRNNGKLYFVSKKDIPGYYFTVDDDILYPEDYVETMLAHLKAFDDKVIVTTHGCRYMLDNSNRVATSAGETLFVTYIGLCDPCGRYVFLHECGNGVSAWHPNRLASKANRFTPPDVDDVDPRDGDDARMAVTAQYSHTPIVRIPTHSNWVMVHVGSATTTALCHNKEARLRRTKQRLDRGAWRLNTTTYPIIRGDCVVLGSYIANMDDAQRGVRWQADPSAVETYIESVRSAGVGVKVLHNCYHDGHNFRHPDALQYAKEYLDKSKYPDNPYYNKFWLPLCWLRDNPAMRYAFVTDSTDVELANSPFGLSEGSELLKPGRIYVGDEMQVIGTPWLVADMNSLGFIKEFARGNRNKLLNSGVMGGHVTLLMEFLEDIVSTYDDVYAECRRVPPVDMGVFNYVCYSSKWWPYIEYGRHVTSVFKAYDRNTAAWFRHK